MPKPEAILQKKWSDYLTLRGWFVKPTHGNMYQSGFPDLFCTHYRYGHRWCEMKILENHRFTAAQLEVFPKLCSFGSGVWVIVNRDFEEQYKCLFKKPNWVWYYSKMI